MKFWTISVCSLALTTAAQAQGDPCERVGRLAELTMEARQLGEPMSSMMAIAQTGTMRILVERAYEMPALYSPEARKRAIREFRNEAELECYRNSKK
jgi:hypothetical protein